MLLTGNIFKEPTNAERELMFKLNNSVCELFEQPDNLKPCQMLNGRRWENLLMIKENPEIRSGYVLKTMEDVCYGQIWLNLLLEAMPVTTNWQGIKIGNWVDLTPKQSFWICRQLRDEPVIQSGIKAKVTKMIEKLEKSVSDIKKFLQEDADLFEDYARKNKIFDTEISGKIPYRSELYTNETLRLQNFAEAFGITNVGVIFTDEKLREMQRKIDWSTQYQ